MNKQPTNDTSLAFEYVLGTLDEKEREAFKAQMARDHRIADEVQFWEANLAPQQDNLTELAPDPQTYTAIQQRIQKNAERRFPREARSSWVEFFLSWRAATASMFAIALVLATLLVQSNRANETPGALTADYVAVLLDQGESPVLTALTTAEGKSLFLKWESQQPVTDFSLQLWSKSRRDGEIRPLMVFNSYDNKAIQLDEATLRLIKDSSHLILTREEVGGSPIDEPSDLIIAKGVCIRFSQPSTNIETT